MNDWSAVVVIVVVDSVSGIVVDSVSEIVHSCVLTAYSHAIVDDRSIRSAINRDTVDPSRHFPCFRFCVVQKKTSGEWCME